MLGPMTVLEAAKHNQGTMYEQAMQIHFARQIPILDLLPFKTLGVGSYAYTQEEALPEGVGFREINAGFTQSIGVLNPQTETLKHAGGDLVVDKAIIRREGPQARNSQEALQAVKLSHVIASKLIKGDGEVLPEEFDGLQKRVGGSQLIDNSTSSGGGALSLTKIDEAIDQVRGANAILCTKAVKRLLSTAARNPSIGGHIDFTLDSFGRRVRTYADLPLIEMDPLGFGETTLGFNEASSGGGSTATSIYVVRLAEDGVTGLQHSPWTATDLGEMETKPQLLTRAEWDVGMAVMSKYAVCRLRGISNAAVVA